MVKSQYHYISGQDLIKFLHKLFGVEIISQKGSHIKIKLKSNHIKTIVPNHKILAYGTFSDILKQLQIHEESFLEFINK